MNFIKTNYLVSTTILTMLLSHLLFSQKLENEKELLLDKYLNSLTKNNSGFTVSIISDTNIIYCKSFGVTNIETRETMKTSNIFHTASVSKTFVATAVMQLVETEKIKLDDYIIIHLPYLKLKDKRYNKITIRQLLNHTSGMPDTDYYGWEKPEFDDNSLENYVKNLITLKLLNEPGKEFHYSNIGYDILGDLISKISKKTFEEYVQQNILLPLEMKESSFYFPNINKKLTVVPHIDNPLKISKTYPYNRIHSPSSTLNASIIDMSKWAIVNLNNGSYKNNKILTLQSFNQMISPATQTDVVGERIGLGWFINKYKNLNYIEHTGSDLGFCSSLTLFPENKVGFIILSNNEGFEIGKVKKKIVEIVLKK